MSDTPARQPAWIDLTVPDATELSQFYQNVCNWQSEPHDMGAYSDYNMQTAGGETVTGICHARDMNAALPPVWIPYFSVTAADASIAEAEARGGEIIERREGAGGQVIAYIRDPAGAVFAIWQQAPLSP